MHDYIEAFDAAQLKDILDANDNAPSINDEQFDRLLELARQHASGESAVDTGLEEHEYEVLIATDWDSFAGNEFGYDGDVNQFALGVYNNDVSSGKGADLFTDVVAVQNGYLATGDGRRAKTEQYEDDDYDGSDPGEMWIPNGAQNYIAIIALDPELLYGEATLADAM